MFQILLFKTNDFDSNAPKSLEFVIVQTGTPPIYIIQLNLFVSLLPNFRVW